MEHPGSQAAAILPWYERRPLVVLAAQSALLATLISPLWYATPDAAAYVSLARRLAHGAPAHAFGDPQPSFPLGYPLIIAPAFWFGDRPFVLLSCIHWLLAVAFMFGLYRWLRRVTPDAAVLLTVGLMANVNVWNLYRRTLSEAAFLPLLLWTINLSNHIGAQRTRSRGPELALLAACLLALVATRETGLVVIAAVAWFGVRARRGSSAAGVLAVSASAVVAGMALLLRPERLAAVGNALRAAFDSPANGVNVILDIARRRVIQVNQLTVPGMFKAYSDPPGWLDWNLLAGAVVLAIVSVGWVGLARRRRDTFLVLGPLFLATSVGWPYDGATRYLLPLIPLIAACGWHGLHALSWRRAFTTAMLIGHLLFNIGYWLVVDLPRARQCNAEWPRLEEIAQSMQSRGETAAPAALPSCEALQLRLLLDLGEPLRES